MSSTLLTANIEHTNDISGETIIKRQRLVALMAIVIASSAVFFQHLTSQRLKQAQYVVNFPNANSGWNGPTSDTREWQPNYKGAQIVENRAYSLAGQVVKLYLVHYGDQQQGMELINSTNALFNRNNWRILSGDVSDFGLQSLSNWKRTVYKSGQRYRLVAWTFDINGQHTNQAISGKAQEVMARLEGSRQGSSLIAVSVDFLEDAEMADEVLQRFLKDHPQLLDPGFLVQPALE